MRLVVAPVVWIALKLVAHARFGILDDVAARSAAFPVDSATILCRIDAECRGIEAVGELDSFEVISQRYERDSIIITSNLPFDEWTRVFGSERLTGAILDRLTHHVVRPRCSNRWRSGPHPRDERRQLPAAPKLHEQDPTTQLSMRPGTGLQPVRLDVLQLHGEHSRQGAPKPANISPEN